MKVAFIPEGKNLFILGLLIFLSSGLLILTNHQGVALKVIIYSFWVLLAGVFLYVRKIEGKSEK